MALTPISQFYVLLIFFKKKLLRLRKTLFINRYLPDRFRWRPSFQRCSFFIFEPSIKWNWCVAHLSWRMLLTTLMKAELRLVLTITLETNTSFTPNWTHSLSISITLSAIRSLSPSALRMSFVPMCRTELSVLTSFCLALAECSGGSVSMQHHQRNDTSSLQC